MKYILILFVLVSWNAEAVDFRDYINKMKKEVNRILGKEPKEIEITMPEIPEVKMEATSTKVYEKKGKLYEQGVEFNKLSNEEKRKYNLAFLRELYPAVRGAEAKESELIVNLNVLEQGGSRESVYRSLVLDQTYASLESYQDIPEPELLDFAVSYGEKYLALRFNKDDIQKLNLFSIKRIIVEKSLEVMDEFPKDGEDLYRWYAILSEDLSENYAKVWKTSVRKKTKAAYHYKWAQSVPFQHIKSEVIVKLHKVMNSF